MKTYKFTKPSHVAQTPVQLQHKAKTIPSQGIRSHYTTTCILDKTFNFTSPINTPKKGGLFPLLDPGKSETLNKNFVSNLH